MSKQDGVIDAALLRPAAPEPVDGGVCDTGRGGGCQGAGEQSRQ